MQDCQVWWTRVGSDADRLVPLLDAAQTRRWSRRRHPASRAAYAIAHATARLVCAQLLDVAPIQVRFTATCVHCGGPHGRPVVRHDGTLLHVSLTHSDDLVGVAVTPYAEVGLDVQRIALSGKQIPLRALSAPERAVLSAMPADTQLAGFVRYWARKEAVLKATGDGLITPPARLTVTPPSEPPALVDWADRRCPEVFLADLSPDPGYRAALAIVGSRLRIVEHDATELLAAYRNDIRHLA